MAVESGPQARLKSGFRNSGPEQTHAPTDVELHASTWAIEHTREITMAVSEQMYLLVRGTTPKQIMLLRLHKRTIDHDVQQPEQALHIAVRMAAQLSQREAGVAHQRKIALTPQDLAEREQGPRLLERFASRECHALNSRPGQDASPQFINRGSGIGRWSQDRLRNAATAATLAPADPQHSPMPRPKDST